MHFLHFLKLLLSHFHATPHGKIEIAKGCMLFDEFLQNYQGLQKNMRILEVGCCYGYNLTYLCEKYDLEGYGIEPSKEAVDYGNDVIKKDKNKRNTTAPPPC